MFQSENAPSPEFLALQAQVAGRYSLDRELGRGGMGVVFLAREVALDRLVAIKLLPPALAANASLRERFLREARTAAQLSHPHIVPIHAVESHEALVFFVMAYVRGETLGERLRARGALPMAEALRVMQEVSWAIAHAHARGVIHRDIKPDNILLEEGSDRALVTDFGIAAFGEGDTPVGAAMGTMHYMSPEQALGADADARGDVYALGVTAFAALAGRRPFEGAEGRALLAQQSGSEAPAIRTLVPALPPAAASVIDRALARDPDQRWPSVEEFASALQGARALEPQLPVRLQRFAREALVQGNQLSAVVGGTLSAAIGAALIDMVVEHNFLGLESFLFLMVAALGTGLTLLMLGLQVASIRGIAGWGYSREAVLRAVRQLEAEDDGSTRRMTGRLGGLWDRPVAVNGLGVLATFLGIVGTVKSESLFGIGFMLVALVAPVITVRRLIELHGVKGSWWGRLFGTKVGKKLWSLVTLGQGKVREAPMSGEPTAIALGGAIHGLYAALPPGEQKLLAEVPDLIDRLAARALDRADPRSVDAVMGLETLRLDLMKLRAGQIAADGMTADYEKLREVGYRVDAAGELQDDR
ncbi:MAG: serine/threonine-protein kinase [Gemmatimonadales bacterium]